jgi:hypothetical protein
VLEVRLVVIVRVRARLGSVLTLGSLTYVGPIAGVFTLGWV